MHHRGDTIASLVLPDDIGSLAEQFAAESKEEDAVSDNQAEGEEVSGQQSEQVEEHAESPQEEEEPLLFSVDDMHHVNEELGSAIDAGAEALLARDSHFLADLDETRPSGAVHSRQHSRHLSRGSQSISRLFLGE